MSDRQSRAEQFYHEIVTVHPSNGELRFNLDAYMSDQPPQTFSVKEVQAKRKKEFLASPQPNWE